MNTSRSFWNHASRSFVLLCLLPLLMQAKPLKIVTSLPDLASIARAVGGGEVEVFAIAAGYQDPHFVDAKPSFLIKLQRADLFVQVGLDLESGWVSQLLEGARNSDILPGGKGFLDVSRGIQLLQVPQGNPASLRAEGDIHIYGNPHYWLDPLRGKQIAITIYERLCSLRPEKQPIFAANLQAFQQMIDGKLAEWQSQIQQLAELNIVAYHNSWPYLQERFGFNIVAFIEPKPGIPPSPKHLAELIRLMNDQKIPVIIIEPYYSRKSAELLAAKSGAVLVELATSVDAYPEIADYWQLFEYNLKKLTAAWVEYRQSPSSSAGSK